ncbi:D-alanyl-D-alanine carboxypeptidase [uncultured Caudovirales phage]|uniref:D-alanyl-D-alanine carboxypeptidase n=1 Tax=uncultured Caudovirales phage TaxID=2100421 RepID=A0A6J7WIN3_9CAUD|nr:D-alanyl-D-alanine carboxypeptidase [uncultured Caudovirales phage]
MDLITIERIKTSHPKLRDELEKDYIECNNLLPKGVRLRFAYVYRSIEEQNKLFAQRPKVTNARGGQSIHNYGLAFDIVILKDKDNNGTFETASFDVDEYWMQVVSYFKLKGWEWGGDWKSFKDKPHFQKTFGHTWQTLSKKEIMINNGLKYPII